MKKNIYAGILLILSIANFFPIISLILFYPQSHALAMLLFFLAFLSPALAVIYLIMITLLIFLKKIRIPVGCIAIAVNIIYLLGSKYYLDMMVYYAT